MEWSHFVCEGAWLRWRADVHSCYMSVCVCVCVCCCVRAGLAVCSFVHIEVAMELNNILVLVCSGMLITLSAPWIFSRLCPSPHPLLLITYSVLLFSTLIHLCAPPIPSMFHRISVLFLNCTLLLPFSAPTPTPTPRSPDYTPPHHCLVLLHASFGSVSFPSVLPLSSLLPSVL